MDHKELLSLIALQHIPGVGSITAKRLVEGAGSAAQIFEHRTELPSIIPGIQPALVKSLDSPLAHQRAEREMEFIDKHHITCIGYHDEAYPYRLRECVDAPTLLFYRGNTTLNPHRVISIVGTRKCTDYGRDLCEALVRDLSAQCPDTLIVSGLAYGIDVCAHRAAIKYGLPTVGVLAHGLDRIYPAAHRNVAKAMLENGGLLTEFMSGTESLPAYFVRRNRIVAGMADATVVVESASSGGSLITASIAHSYSRDCFAFPGRVTDENSKGCNALICSNRAALITCAADFVEAMNWSVSKQVEKPRQMELFTNLTPEEEIVMQQLAREGMTMLVVTHEMAFARDVSNRVVYMNEGVICEEGAPEDVFGNPQKQETRDFLARFRRG
mgnify:CR=1 FL=1